MTADAKPGRVVRYNDEGYRALIDTFESMRTFADITVWDTKAKEEVIRIQAIVQQLSEIISEENGIIQNEQRERDQKSFLERLFSSRKVEQEAEVRANKYREHILQLDGLADNLIERIDFSPNSAADKKTILQALRLRKKELQTEKREINLEMRAIRTSARQQSAEISPAYGSRFFSHLDASRRYDIRTEKEAALRPNEDKKAAIERQLLQTDRRINWVMRLEQ